MSLLKQKFRVWDSKNKKLIYSKPTKNYEWKFNEEGEFECWYNDILVKREIEQFTGKKDIEGNEIYHNDFIEGDIDLSYRHVVGSYGLYKEIHLHHIGQIIKEKVNFILIINSDDNGHNFSKYTNLKLLGNIHETPGRCGNCRFFRPYEYGGSYGNGLCFAVDMKKHPRKELYEGINCEIREIKLKKDKEIRNSFKVGDKVIGKGEHHHRGAAGQSHFKGKIGTIIEFIHKNETHEWYESRKFKKIYVKVKYSKSGPGIGGYCWWRFEDIKLIKVGPGGL